MCCVSVGCKKRDKEEYSTSTKIHPRMQWNYKLICFCSAWYTIIANVRVAHSASFVEQSFVSMFDNRIVMCPIYIAEVINIKKKKIILLYSDGWVLLNFCFFFSSVYGIVWSVIWLVTRAPSWWWTFPNDTAHHKNWQWSANVIQYPRVLWCRRDSINCSLKCNYIVH